MSTPGESQLEKPEQVEPFKERIDLLFEELSFAVQWHRPSILLALHESEGVRDIVELVLESRLAEIGQQLVQFKVGERHFDIPLLLSKRANRDRSVYSVTGLSRGGGKNGANAYRALNIRREYFVDHAIRVIVWLSRDEATDLSRHAPDFWAFRHHVVEFYDSLDAEFLALSANELSMRALKSPIQPEVLQNQISLYEAELAKLSSQEEFLSRRMDVLSVLASLYLEKQAYDTSLRKSKHGILLARRLDDTKYLAGFWGELGRAYLELKQPIRAIRAYWKAIRYNSQDTGLWIGLEQTYLLQGRVGAARSVLRTAARVRQLDKNT